MNQFDSARRPDGWIFVLFLAQLVWAPIPLASNRAWAWSVLEIGVFALSACWLTLYALGKVRFATVFRSAWWALALFGVWLARLSPALVEMSATIGAAWSTMASTISVDARCDVGLYAEEPRLFSCHLSHVRTGQPA